VAIKCYKVDTTENGIDIGIMREIVYLKSLPPHVNIIHLTEVEWIGNRLRVAMPLYETDLNKYVKKKLNCRPMPGAQVVEFSRKILHGLHHLHQHGVFIRDLKPANILLNLATGDVVLCDFSLASTWCSKLDHSQTIQTLWYRAIEVLLGLSKYDTAVDMWSFGCVLGFMLKGHDVLPGDSDYGQIMLTFEMLGTPTEATWPGLESLPYFSREWPKFDVPERLPVKFPLPALEKLFRASLQMYPKERCTAQQALEMI